MANTLSAVDAVVVVSEYMRRSLLQAEPTLGARLHRITRPVRQPTPRRRPLRQHPDDPTIIVCAGRITAEKGQAVVLEAAGMLRTRGPVELRIAGVIEDNAYWTHCQRLQTRATSRNPQLTVDYLGHLDYDAIDEVFADADIVTVPSQWPEPLGAVALEAMAAGAVVVASDIGGLADIITNDHNGIRVHPNDVTAWTTAIGSLIDTPQRARGLVERADTTPCGELHRRARPRAGPHRLDAPIARRVVQLTPLPMRRPQPRSNHTVALETLRGEQSASYWRCLLAAHPSRVSRDIPQVTVGVVTVRGHVPTGSTDDLRERSSTVIRRLQRDPVLPRSRRIDVVLLEPAPPTRRRG